VLGPLTSRNPGLRLEVAATDSLVDIVEEGFDAGVRLGEVLSQDMIAVRIRNAQRFAVVGSPAYFKDRPPLSTPRDLGGHLCIRYRFPSGKMFNWEFERGGEAMAVEVEGPMTFDNQELMVEAALQSCGLAYVWEDRIRGHLQSGALIRRLEDWSPPANDVFLYYSSRRHLSGGLRALIAALKA
jgi:DNA-binding transcriptional LysR family regulator